jgi:hypothetical protein
MPRQMGDTKINALMFQATDDGLKGSFGLNLDGILRTHSAGQVAQFGNLREEATFAPGPSECDGQLLRRHERLLPGLFPPALG